MQRDDIKKAVSALVPEGESAENLDSVVSALLNLFHGELNAAKKASTDAAEKAAKAEAKAANADAQAAANTELQSKVEKLEAALAAANKRSNTANAVAKLVQAGMNETLASSIAATSVSEDEKASTAAIDAIITAYSAQEQAKAAETAKAGMLNMQFPAPNGENTNSGAVDLAKRLASQRADRKNSGTLDEFRQKT